MDDIVKQAMAKWPNVPAVYGWLGLDQRGNWLIKGDRITNPIVSEFISRNYERDEQGRWYFQNGPQRVFVTLAYTPVVYRVATGDAPGLVAHTGAAVTELRSAWVDDHGILMVDTDQGAGIVDDRDLDCLLPWFTDSTGEVIAEDVIGAALEDLQAGGHSPIFIRYGGRQFPVTALRSSDAPATLGFVQRPEPPPGEEACY